MAQNKTEQSSKVEHRGEGNFLAQLELSSSTENGGTEIVIDFDADWDRDRDERRENHKNADTESKLEKGRPELKSSGKKMLLFFASLKRIGFVTLSTILCQFLRVEKGIFIGFYHGLEHTTSACILLGSIARNHNSGIYTTSLFLRNSRAFSGEKFNGCCVRASAVSTTGVGVFRVPFFYEAEALYI